MESVGQRIRDGRLAVGLDQDRLAKLVGVSSKAVSMWERGVSTPQAGNLAKLANVLERSPRWIIEGDVPNEWDAIQAIQERLLKLEESVRRLEDERRNG